VANVAKDRLTPLQQRFVDQYMAGADGIRLSATAAYVAAGGKGKTGNTIAAEASRLLNNPKVQRALQLLRRAADAKIIAQLVDWKVAAVEAQPRLLALSKGVLPNARAMADRDDAAVGQVILGALKEIVDRGFPKNLKLTVNPREALLELIGRQDEVLPEHHAPAEDA
jgi:hypothetical protein